VKLSCRILYGIGSLTIDLNFSLYRYDTDRGVITVNFPEYPDIFSKLNRVLYVGIGHDNEGLEELAKRHGYVVGVDKRICDTPRHVEERENLLRKYPNLCIRPMDGRKLDFPCGCFDGVIFRRSLAWGTNAINNEKDIKCALDETYRILSEEGLVWIIYERADTTIGLTSDRMNSVLKSSGFGTIMDTKNYKICRKTEREELNTVDTKAKNQKLFLPRIKEYLVRK